jgi:ABC-type sugar transport system ATPase subunit
MFYVTHVAAEVPAIADRVAMMGHGRIVGILAVHVFSDRRGGVQE